MPALILKRPIPNVPNSATADGISSGTIVVSWGDTNAGAADTEVWRSLNGRTEWALTSTVPAELTTFTHSIGTAGATRYYKLRARIGNQKSKFTGVFSGMTLAGTPAPTNLQLTVDGSNQITANWTDNTGGLATYLVEKSLNGSDWTTVATTNAGATSQIVNALAANTLYHIGVTAQLDGSNSSRVTAQATTDSEGGTIPADPTSLTITPSTSTRANWAWTDNADNEEGYKIERAPDETGSPGTYVEIDDIGGNQTSYSSNDQLAETTYWGRVKAYNATGDSAYSNAVQYTMPAAPSSDVAFLPEFVAQVQTKAALNTAQWQAFKAQLDSELNTVIAGAYQGGEITRITGYALGYQCLKVSDPSTAAAYADRALGLLRGSCRQMMSSVGADVRYWQFLGRGDDVETTFALPDTPTAGTVGVRRAVVETVPVTRHLTLPRDLMPTPNTNRFIIKVSDTSDGADDYVAVTDWNHGKYGPDWMIDWTGAGSAPTPGNTYYITRASSYQATILTTGWSVVGANIVFTAPPASGTCIFARCLYNETGGLTRQQTIQTNGPGFGFRGMFNDASFPTRYLGFLAIAYDWLYDYADFPLDLKAEFEELAEQWLAVLKTGNKTNIGLSPVYSTYTLYQSFNPASNYGAGSYLMAAALAIALETRVAAGATHKADLIARRTTTVQPVLLDPTGNQTTLSDGHWTEGWTYGTGSARNLVMVGMAMEQAGWVTATEETDFANDLLKTWVHEQPTRAYIYSGGDGPSNPYPAPAKTHWAYQSGMASDVTVAAYARDHIQSVSGSLANDYLELLFYDPDGDTIAPSTVEPLSRLCVGGGMMFWRNAWDYASVWLSFEGAKQPGAGHGSYTPSNILLYRGADILIPDGFAISGGPQAIPQKQVCASVVLTDDNRSNLMNYRWTPASFHATGSTQVLAYENAAAYGYGVVDHKASYRKNSAGATTTAHLTRLDRALLFVRPDYVFVYDRIVTTDAAHPKWLVWYEQTTDTATVNTDRIITAGTFTLTHDGNTTNPIAWNAAAATVLAELQALPSIGSGNCTVTLAPDLGSAPTTPAGTYFVTFTNAEALVDQPLITGDGSGLTTASGGLGRVTVRDYTSQSGAWDNIQQRITLGVTIADQTYSKTTGSSKLFTQIYSATPIEAWQEWMSGYSTTRRLRRVMCRNTSDTAAMRWLTLQQAASSATGAMDSHEFINATLFEGARLGNVVALFGKAHTAAGDTGYIQDTTGGTSYSFTGTGSTITHYVTDLTPSQQYTLSGDASGTPTASAEGVLSFTTSGSGAKTVVIT